VAEGFKLADVTAGLAVLVDAAGVVAGAKILVAGGRIGEHVPDDEQVERATATRTLSLPHRLTRRRWRSPGKVSVLAAAAAASPRIPLR
jgi:hypothetical protein